MAAEETAPYRIEIGMFRHRENAEILASNLQKDGFDCYIVPRENYYCVCHGSYETQAETEKEEKILFEAGYETRLIRADDC